MNENTSRPTAGSGREPASLRSRLSLFFVYILTAALLAGGAVMALRARTDAVPVAAMNGARAPEFNLEVLGKPGERIALSDYRGRPVVIVFNCGCKLCYDFNHALRDAAPKLEGLEVVGIMMNHWSYAPDQVRNFRETTGFRWPLLMDLKSQTTMAYKSDDCPRAWLVDRNGIIRYHNESNEMPAQEIVAGLIAAYEKL
jgi:peroxiredoxin